MTHTATQRSWINPEKARYYQVFLDQDLFGYWTLIKVWDGIGSNRGRMHSTDVASYEAGIELIDEIARRRTQRGYIGIVSAGSCVFRSRKPRRDRQPVSAQRPCHWSPNLQASAPACEFDEQFTRGLL